MVSHKIEKIFVEFAILSLLILLLSVDARNWQIGNDGIKWTYDCEFIDYDIGKVDKVTQVECFKQCTDHGGCNAFNYQVYPFGDQGTCYLKKIPNDLASSNKLFSLCGWLSLKFT